MSDTKLDRVFERDIIPTVNHGLIRALKSEISSSRIFFFCSMCYNFFVEFKGATSGEGSMIDTWIEGFDSPWLHDFK